MKKIQFEIMGKSWVLRLPKRRRYTASNGSDSVAVTKGNKRVIDLGPHGRDLETIVHELVHAYLAEMCLHSADIDPIALEEIVADMVSKRGRELLDLGDKLFELVKEAKDE